jgi:succinyl-diaminopimelate desuccinylase
VRGVQAHIAYPQLGRNPIHQLAPALAELAAAEWDRGNADFGPTSFQVSNVHGGTGATNVIPNSVVVDFNFRFSTESTAESLKSRLEAVLKKHALDYAVEWTLGGKPFRTRRGRLVEVLSQSIKTHAGRAPELSTTGGTSDARFIADICPEIVEFGPVNASIHKLNEHIGLAELEKLPDIYLDTLRALLP